MTADLLRRAADAMVAEAERYEALHDGMRRGFVVHSRNTYARDGATLRALAAHLRAEARVDRRGYPGLEDVARAFLGETPTARPGPGTDAPCAVCGTARAEHTATIHAWTGEDPGRSHVHRVSS